MVKAEIKNYNGKPSIFINGKYIKPFMFWVRPGNGKLEFDNDDLDAQMALLLREQNRAAKYGVNIISVFMWMDTDTGAGNNSVNREVMHRLIKNNPECYILPRVLLSCDQSVLGTPDYDNERFSDGKGNPGEDFKAVDFISEKYIDKMLSCLKQFINMVKDDPLLSEHVIGYHFSGGHTGEWFQRRYWSNVLNISNANRDKFSEYLKNKYGTSYDADNALNKIAHYLSNENEYRCPFVSDKLFIDYNDYFSEEIVNFLERAARMVKEETERNSLFITFYGYNLEIPGGYSGHCRLHRLLNCNDVDILSGPVSYNQRNEGGIGAFMTEVSTIADHGKLWMDESDYRIPNITDESINRPDCIDYISDMHVVKEVIVRECAKVAMFGAGTWWMDLFGRGWWDCDEVWKYESEGEKYYTEITNNIKRESPDVVYIIDEKATALVGNVWKFSYFLHRDTRSAAYRSGLSFDFRLLDDFIEGKASGAKIYVFVNPFRITRNGLDSLIKKKLYEYKATAVWLGGFAPDDNFDKIKNLTGFKFDITDETADQIIVSVDGEEKTIEKQPVEYLCAPICGEKLGEYNNGKSAFSKAVIDGHNSYYFGGTSMPIEIIQMIAEAEGVNVYSKGRDTFMKIGNVTLFHSATSGEKSLHFLDGNTIKEIRSGKVYTQNNIDFYAELGETFIFIEE